MRHALEDFQSVADELHLRGKDAVEEVEGALFLTKLIGHVKWDVSASDLLDTLFGRADHNTLRKVFAATAMSRDPGFERVPKWIGEFRVRADWTETLTETQAAIRDRLIEQLDGFGGFERWLELLEKAQSEVGATYIESAEASANDSQEKRRHG